MIPFWAGSLIAISLIGYICFIRLNNPETRPWFFPALFFKLLTGIAVGLVYMHYYHEGDTLRFHSESVKLYEFAHGNIMPYLSFLVHGGTGHPVSSMLGVAEEPRTLFFIKFLSILNFISGGNYWINSLYLSLLSFTGCWYFIYTVTDFDRKNLFAVVIPFAFLPSMVFWASGILKESLAMFSIGLMMSVFLKFYLTGRFRILYLLIFIPACWICWNIKYYVTIVLVAAMIAVYLSQLRALKNRFINESGRVTILFLILLLAGTFTHPNFSAGRILEVLHENHEKIALLSDKRNVVPFIPSGDPAWNFIINIPVSLFAGLFMPLPFQGDSLIVLVPGMINLFVLLTCMFLIYRRFYLPEGKLRSLVYGVLLYTTTLSILIAYATPNFGTLERYKVSYLPLFLFMVLAGLRPDRRIRKIY